MGIELGSIGSAIGNAVGSLGRAGAGAAPALPGLGRFGVEMTAPVLPINEGVPGLEHIMSSAPLQIGKSVEIRFINEPVKGFDLVEPAVSDLSPVNIVAEAESIVAQAQAPLNEEVVLAGVNEVLGIKEPLIEPNVVPLRAGQPDFWSIPDIALSPALQPATQVEEVIDLKPKLQPSAINRTSTEASPAASPQEALEEQEVEEEVLEKTVEEKMDMVEESKLDKKPRFYLVDKRALTRRMAEIKQAFKYAKAETEKLGGSTKNVFGKLIAKFIPREHAGNRSAIVQPYGPDGSYEATKRTIETGLFSSEDQVEAVALANRPVEIGEDGEIVGEEEVKKVQQGRVVKPLPKVVEIVTKRILKKQKPTTSHPDQNMAFVISKSLVKTEQTLGDLNLEGVFQKAA